MNAIFPGSFDPLTNGHLDLIARATGFVDKLYVAILVNPDKPGYLPVQTRKELVEAACLERGLEAGVEVLVDTGLLTDLARRLGVRMVIRGLRNCADLEQESAMARANALLLPGLETILLPAGDTTSGISSSLIRQVASLGGEVGHFVPACVARALQDLNNKQTTQR